MKLATKHIVKGFYDKVKNSEHFKTNGVLDTNKFCIKLIAEYPECRYTSVERYLRANISRESEVNIVRPMGVSKIV